MTKEDVETYIKLDKQIRTKALNIANEINKIWPLKYEFRGNLDDIEEFSIENNCNIINISTSEYYCGDVDTYRTEIPIEWLSMDIEDVKSFVINEKQDYDRRKEEANKIAQKNEKERKDKEEYEHFLELKKKFENE